MDEQRLKGLVGTIGKQLAKSRDRDEHLSSLGAVKSGPQLRGFLEVRDLGIAAQGKREFTDGVTGPDWEDWHARLVRSLNVQLHEYLDASA